MLSAGVIVVNPPISPDVRSCKPVRACTHVAQLVDNPGTFQNADGVYQRPLACVLKTGLFYFTSHAVSNFPSAKLGGHSFVACLARLAFDHESLSRRSNVLTWSRHTFNMYTLPYIAPPTPPPPAYYQVLSLSALLPVSVRVSPAIQSCLSLLLCTLLLQHQ